ncbi:MAG TPA: M48 family metallopeptidase [Puia sp.]|nr:M48 family metallopeptidase [Puia sp.]
MFFVPAVRAQEYDFLPVAEDISLLTTLSGKCQQRYKDELDKLPSKNKKDFLEAYAQRWENVKEKFDKQEIYTSAFAQKYLDGLVAEIRSANPMLRDRSFTCYFSRSDIPNASYIGEGVILFNMGLFHRLGNESQAAFVLCHEIAHFLLQHTENSIDKYVTTINSPEVQAELRKIKGSEYRKNEQLQRLVKGLTFGSRRHSRDHESEADSVGVELLRNTRYDVAGALSALALLDVIDTDTLNTLACLPNVFDSKEFPFQKKWIAREEGLLGGHAHIKDLEMADSLKTHPACQQRIRLLIPLVNRSHQPVALKFVSDSSTFVRLQGVFRYEAIEYAYVMDNYTRSLFLSLELLQAKPGDGYLVAHVGKVLNGLYSAQKSHTLSKVAAFPAPQYPPNYNLLLQFIQNLYLEDIAAINCHYLKKYHPAMDRYPPFKEAYEKNQKIIQQDGAAQK